jgi:hypothetical protein
LTEHNLSENYIAPKIYLNRCKLNVEYSKDNGTKNPIATEAFVMYADAADFSRLMTLLTKVSSLRNPINDDDPFFIPLALKFQNPAKFGRYVSKQNTFLNQHRNISIVGGILEAMDYSDKDELSLYDMIKKLPGVYRCDQNRRTHDLGKWNISCNLEHHTAICTWIDTHMVEIWKTIPIELSPVTTFPKPESLSKGRRAQSGTSVASGLADASPVAAYIDSLEKNLVIDTNEAAAHSSRNPWKAIVPVEDVSYLFTLTAFPKLANENTTSTTADETSAAGRGQATAVSAITEGFVSSAVKTSISALDEHRKTESANFTERLHHLEDRLQGITGTINSVSEKTTDAVILRLTKPDGLITQQNGLITQQNKQLTEQFATMTKMYRLLETATDNLETMTTDRNSDRYHEQNILVTGQARSPRERETTTDDAADNDCSSPDRTK